MCTMAIPTVQRVYQMLGDNTCLHVNEPNDAVRLLNEQHSNAIVWLTSSSIRFRFKLNVKYKYRVKYT